MKAYELGIKLWHLTLAGQNEDGELEFIGTDKQWKKTEELINNYEFINDVQS